MWQHALEYIDEQVNKEMENKYMTLNKKLDNLLENSKQICSPFVEWIK
jgi:hypothetical protein